MSLQIFWQKIEAAIKYPNYGNLLTYYDCSSGVSPIGAILPYQLQKKNGQIGPLITKGAAPFPFRHFFVFANFIKEISKVKNDPGFDYERSSFTTKELPPNKSTHSRPTISARKTEVTPSSASLVIGPDKVCAIRNTKHILNVCRSFLKPNLLTKEGNS